MSFLSFSLNPKLVNALPKTVVSATAVQQKSIPAVLKGQDVIALAQTGSGKTFAFGLPILHCLERELTQASSEQTGTLIEPRTASSVSALVIVPTRELAKQVADELSIVSAELRVQVDMLCGGEDIDQQIIRLASPSQLIVATPGRLLALATQGHIRFEKIKHLVLDEADRLLDMGFITDIKALIAMMPPRQTLLFSATMPETLDKLTQQVLSADAVRIEANKLNTTVDEITQTIYHINKGSKAKAIIDQIKLNDWTQVVIFVNAKNDADALCKKLLKAKISAASLHGDKEQALRSETLRQFKAKQLAVIVTTDVLSRGIHIDGLPAVINFELPEQASVYVHRIGRTARAGLNGVALSFVSHAEIVSLTAIRELTGLDLPLCELEGYPVTDKPVDPNSKKPPKDKQANRRTAKKRSISHFTKKPATR